MRLLTDVNMRPRVFAVNTTITKQGEEKTPKVMLIYCISNIEMESEVDPNYY